MTDAADSGFAPERTDSGENDDDGDSGGNMLSQFSRETGYTMSPAAFGQLAGLRAEPRHLVPILRHGSVDAKIVGDLAEIREAPGMVTLQLDAESMADLLRRGVVGPEDSRKVAGLALRVDEDRVIQSVMRVRQPLFPNAGDVMDCTVRHVSGPRVFVVSDDGFDGILNEIEFSYLPVQNIYDHLQPGDRIRLVVWRTEPDGKIWYSFRRRFPNPWWAKPFPYAEGQVLNGMVLYHIPGGCLVELPNATVGYLDRRQEMYVSGGQYALEDGQTVAVQIARLDFRRFRIQLSAPRAGYA